MSESNKATARRWFEEVWNQGRKETIHELFAGEGVAHGLGDSEADVVGPAQFEIFAGNLRGALPDLNITVDDILSEGDSLAIRVTLRGKHTGHGLGVEPTGRKVNIQGIIIARLRNGQLIEAWNSYDQLGLLRQIGALPTPNGDIFLDAPHIP